MKPACRDFRAELERRLSTAREAEPLAALGWHEHLLACGDCRALLAAEEALEDLLASLPHPRLPRRLAERLIVRLREAQAEERALDALLELDAAGTPPARLAERVKLGIDARLAREEAALDAVLARDRIDAPERLSARVLAAVRDEEARVEARLDALLDRDRVLVPRGLASRVVAHLRATEPAVSNVRSIAPLPASRARRVPTWMLAAAAAIVVLFAVWRFVARDGATDAPPIVQEGLTPNRARNAELPGPDVLAALDVLEQWELLVGEDVDLLLSTLEPAVESLLEEGASEPVEAAPKDDPKQPETKRG